jgi:hypothetical protein
MKYKDKMINGIMVEDLKYEIFKLLNGRKVNQNLIDFLNDHFRFKNKEFEDCGGFLNRDENYKDFTEKDRLIMFDDIIDIYDVKNLMDFLFKKDGEFLLRSLQRKFQYTK